MPLSVAPVVPSYTLLAALMPETVKVAGDMQLHTHVTTPNAVVCVLSDHGFTRTDHNFNIVAAFAVAATRAGGPPPQAHSRVG